MYKRLFPPPALYSREPSVYLRESSVSRRHRIERKPAALLTPADAAYLEGFDAASAYPGEIADLLQGITDGLHSAKCEAETAETSRESA